MRNQDHSLWEALYAEQVSAEQTAIECDFIERLMPLEKFPDILDLACGTGRHSIELASRGYNVTGVDINVQALRNAAGIAAASNLDVRFLPADLRELYYIDGRFNGIVIFWENFGFQYPYLLALLALLPVYAFLVGRIGKVSALRFSSADLARAAGAAARAAAGRLLLLLRLFTIALCIVALAGPRFSNDRTETQASGVDIMLALDLSWSMMALDMGPPREHVSRYDIASTVLEDFIRKRPSDRMGLIVFSGVP